MKKLLVSAAAATMLMAAAPAFAGPAEQGLSPYPSAGTCHFVLERTITQDGRVILQRQQVCE